MSGAKKLGNREEFEYLRQREDYKKLIRADEALKDIEESIGTKQGAIERIKNKPESEMSSKEKKHRINVLERQINTLAGNALRKARILGVEQ